MCHRKNSLLASYSQPLLHSHQLCAGQGRAGWCALDKRVIGGIKTALGDYHRSWKSSRNVVFILSFSYHFNKEQAKYSMRNETRIFPAAQWNDRICTLKNSNNYGVQ